MTLADLEHASVVVEDPVRLAYHDAFTVLGAPPSTAGGLVTLETLGLIDRFPIGESPEWAFGKANTLHVTLDAMRLAFADRDWFIGDDAKVAVPVDKMLGRDYLTARGAPISLTSRIPEPTLPGDPSAYAPDPVDPDGCRTRRTSRSSTVGATSSR
jgi:gamma-glutamyltranspeptidase/glutathione hydrolase